MKGNENKKRIIVLVNKIKTIDIIEEKMEMVMAGYHTLKDEREDIQKELESATLERNDKIRLVHNDKSKTKEQKRLISLRDQLLAKKEEILEKEAAEINGYEPEEVEW